MNEKEGPEAARPANAESAKKRNHKRIVWALSLLKREKLAFRAGCQLPWTRIAGSRQKKEKNAREEQTKQKTPRKKKRDEKGKMELRAEKKKKAEPARKAPKSVTEKRFAEKTGARNRVPLAKGSESEQAPLDQSSPAMERKRERQKETATRARKTSMIKTKEKKKENSRNAEAKMAQLDKKDLPATAMSGRRLVRKIDKTKNSSRKTGTKSEG